jgi:hypothetical protein
MRRKTKNEKEECGERKHTTAEALHPMMYPVIFLATLPCYNILFEQDLPLHVFISSLVYIVISLVVSYEHETWSLTLREEQRATL